VNPEPGHDSRHYALIITNIPAKMQPPLARRIQSFPQSLFRYTMTIPPRSKKIPEIFFLANSVYTPPHNPELSPTIQKPDKTSQNAQFSDVIAIAGNSGASGSISLKKPPEICAKKSDPQKPVKLQDQIAIKSIILER